MEPGTDFIPTCPPPWEQPIDVVPMLVVVACFGLLGWLFRVLRRRRKAGRDRR